MTVGRIPSVEGGIQPTILDAKGDLIVATGNDSPNRLAVGANNLVLTADSAQATGVKWAAPDPLTTKGDLFTYSTIEARLAVGANDTVLTADSTAATGLKWATPSSGGMTLLSTTTLSGATVTISSISQSYKRLVAYIYGVTNATSTGLFSIKPNNTANIVQQINNSDGAATIQIQSNNINLGTSNPSGGEGVLYTSANNFWCLNIENYASSSANKSFSSYGAFVTPNASPAYRPWFSNGGINTTTAISSLVFSNSGGNLSTGTVLLYGVS